MVVTPKKVVTVTKVVTLQHSEQGCDSDERGVSLYPPPPSALRWRKDPLSTWTEMGFGRASTSILLSYVTLPFNVGRPFCLMDVKPVVA